MIAARQRVLVAFSGVLTVLATGCADGHIQSQERSQEEGGMSVRAVRPAQVLDAPVRGEVIDSIGRGQGITALCFGRQASQPFVQVEAAVEGFVTLERQEEIFDAGIGELRSVLARCESTILRGTP